MSRKKNIGAYHKKQEEARKKAVNQKRIKIFSIILAIVLGVALLSTISALVITDYVEEKREAERLALEAERLAKAYDDPITVAMDVKNYGTITLEVYPNLAPESVQAFLGYVESGFYDGLTFHRVIEDFMIQGGDPSGTDKKDLLKDPIKGEFSKNGFTNPLEFTRGVIGMARTDVYDSATSQFFICHETSTSVTSLNGSYASFGKVIDGMDVVDKIATCPKTSVQDKAGNYYIPSETVEIERVYVK